MSLTWAVLQTTRPKFLILAPLCTGMGVLSARADTGNIDGTNATLAVLAAVLAHVSVNCLNEYHDFKSGLDAHTIRTPFSGGSGALPSEPGAANATLLVGLLSLLWVVAIGGYFLSQFGPAVLPLGLLGIGIVGAYTPWLTRHPLLCLVAPGLAFGPLMVVGSHFAVSGHYSVESLLLSLVPFCLASELLLINQLPDVDADRRVGRRTLPIAIGNKRSAAVSIVLLGTSFLAQLAMNGWGNHSSWLGLGLLPLPVAVIVAFRVYVNAERPEALIPYMGLNVAVILSSLLLMDIGLLLAS